MLKKIIPHQSKCVEEIGPVAPEIIGPEQIEIPPKLMFGTDLKQLKGFRILRITLKQQAMLKDFIESMSNILDLGIGDKFDHEVVRFIMQSAEDYFVTHKKTGDLKRQATIAVCKRYFNDDEQLVSTIIDMVLPSIIKTSFMRRNKNKIIGLFLMLLSMFGKKSNR